MLEQTFRTPLPTTLDVSIPSGEIEVETEGGEETALTIDGDERLLEAVEVHQDGSRVVVSVRDKGKFGISLGSLVFGGGGLRVQARVPHGGSVKIKTASADTELSGHFGRLELNSVSGDVRLRGEIAEDARVKTVSGDVELERVDGDLSVQCVSGDVRARAITGSVDTKSVSGDIRLDALTAGDVRFTSVSGDIEIGIAPGSLLDVDAGSTSGDLSSEVPLASEPPSGEGTAAPTVILRGRTVSGDVRVFRAG
jgi:putative adhesin